MEGHATNLRDFEAYVNAGNFDNDMAAVTCQASKLVSSQALS